MSLFSLNITNYLGLKITNDFSYVLYKGEYNGKTARLKISSHNTDNEIKIYTNNLNGAESKYVPMCYDVITISNKFLLTDENIKYFADRFSDRIDVLILEDPEPWGFLSSWLKSDHISALSHDVQVKMLNHMIRCVAKILIAFKGIGLVHNNLEAVDILARKDKNYKIIELKITNFDKATIVAKGGNNNDWFSFVKDVHHLLKSNVTESIINNKISPEEFVRDGGSKKPYGPKVPSGKCKLSTHAKFTSRLSPHYPPNDCRGKTRKGKDGNSYVSTPMENGVYRWKKK